jgi:8-oxo-dGTP pyrophosphatase MutT (NUDIX family)
MTHCQVCCQSTAAELQKRKIRYCPRCGGPFPERPLAPQERQVCGGCGYTHYLNPSPGVTVIVESPEGRVLIAKRSPAIAFGGQWCLPGGYIEYEETFLAAARREVWEETGLTVRLKGIVNVVSNQYRGDHHTLVVVLLAEVLAGEPVAADDVTELRWIGPQEHRRIGYAFEADRRIIDDYFAGHLQRISIDERFREGAAPWAPIGECSGT